MMLSLVLCYWRISDVLYKDITRLDFSIWTTKAVHCMPEGYADGCTNTTRLRFHIFLHPVYACVPAKRAV